MNAQKPSGGQPALDPQQETLVIIAALTATGQLDSLEEQLQAGLEKGLSVNEVKEALVQLYAYCGFPRSLNAISTFMKVVNDRKAKGIQDKDGAVIILSPDEPGKYERGRKVLEELTKTAQARPAPGFGEFAPRIDAFLKEHLFADVFDSKVLTYQQRELVTVSALAAMSGTAGQLQSHLKMAMNTGVTNLQLASVSELIEKHINRTQANVMRKLISIPELPVIRKDMMIRIAEIEIVPEFLEEYKAILKTHVNAALLKEPGVIAIFPMYQAESPLQVKVVEVYADEAAYRDHLQTTHFKVYKSSTAKMVKSLKLVDMSAMDVESMGMMFGKMK